MSVPLLPLSGAAGGSPGASVLGVSASEGCGARWRAGAGGCGATPVASPEERWGAAPGASGGCPFPAALLLFWPLLPATPPSPPPLLPGKLPPAAGAGCSPPAGNAAAAAVSQALWTWCKSSGRLDWDPAASASSPASLPSPSLSSVDLAKGLLTCRDLLEGGAPAAAAVPAVPAAAAPARGVPASELGGPTRDDPPTLGTLTASQGAVLVRTVPGWGPSSALFRCTRCSWDGLGEGLADPLSPRLPAAATHDAVRPPEGGGC